MGGLLNGDSLLGRNKEFFIWEVGDDSGVDVTPLNNLVLFSEWRDGEHVDFDLFI